MSALLVVNGWVIISAHVLAQLDLVRIVGGRHPSTTCLNESRNKCHTLLSFGHTYLNRKGDKIGCQEDFHNPVWTDKQVLSRI